MKMDRDFHEVGCRKCGKGGHWKIYHDGNGHFKAMHPCGHISDFVVVKEKDTQPIVKTDSKGRLLIRHWMRLLIGIRPGDKMMIKLGDEFLVAEKVKA